MPFTHALVENGDKFRLGANAQVIYVQDMLSILKNHTVFQIISDILFRAPCS